MKTIQLKDVLRNEISQWNEVDKVASLLSIDAAGTCKTISPANLLKVQRKGYVPASGFNDAISEGCYNITDPKKAYPNNPGIDYGILSVAHSGDLMAQYVFEMFGTHRIFFRIRNERGQWQPWASFLPASIVL